MDRIQLIYGSPYSYSMVAAKYALRVREQSN
jgi:hypothetical protein